MKQQKLKYFNKKSATMRISILVLGTRGFNVQFRLFQFIVNVSDAAAPLDREIDIGFGLFASR
jgi:hypothetical protein